MALYPADADGFWRRTPREIFLLLKAATERLAREHNERMSEAWHTAALPRGKRFPALEKLLVGAHKRRPRRQDPKALEALLMTW